MSLEKVDYVKQGQKIINDNHFYKTLSLLLKYYFITKEKDFNFLNFVKEITNTENEFKVFMVFKEYSIYIYHSKVSNIIDSSSSIEDIIYTIIFYVKNTYENDRSVIKPFIISISDNENEVLEKFHSIKSTYILKNDSLDKFEQLKTAITYLEKAQEYDEKAKFYNKLALETLIQIKNHFDTTIKYVKK
jgi:hypothetical protein